MRELEIARMRAALESGEIVGDAHEQDVFENNRERTVATSTRHRPTGKTPMFWGLLGIVLGTLMALTGTLADVFWLMLLGGGLANIGTIALVAGYIVHAISFLPGAGKRK